MRLARGYTLFRARLGFRRRWRAGGGGSFNKITLLPSRSGVAGGGGGRGGEDGAGERG